MLLYLKLKSPRAKDRADVIELIKAGADVARARSFLVAHAAQFIPALDRAVDEARAEEEERASVRCRSAQSPRRDVWMLSEQRLEEMVGDHAH